MSGRIYFDWAATAPPCALSHSAEVPFGNPSSAHAEGRAAKQSLEAARHRLAAVLGVSAARLFFTSGGTESDTIILHSVLAAYFRTKKALIVTTAAEHPAVTENCALLEKCGVKVVRLPLDEAGDVDIERTRLLFDKLCEFPALVSVMAVNNETGVVNNLSALAKLVRSRWGERVLIHSDMVQALGKIDCAEVLRFVDAASFSAHKIGGPRGIGALYCAKNSEVFSRGGGQEGGLRSGTENVAGAELFAAALEKSAATFDADREGAERRMRYIIEEIEKIVTKTGEKGQIIPSCRIARDSRFSPWIVQAAFPGTGGEVLARVLDDEGIAVSTGSACHTGHGDKKERAVLAAMGIAPEIAFAGIRISQGSATTQDEAAALIETLHRVVPRL